MSVGKNPFAEDVGGGGGGVEWSEDQASPTGTGDHPHGDPVDELLSCSKQRAAVWVNEQVADCLFECIGFLGKGYTERAAQQTRALPRETPSSSKRGGVLDTRCLHLLDTLCVESRRIRSEGKRALQLEHLWEQVARFYNPTTRLIQLCENALKKPPRYGPGVETDFERRACLLQNLARLLVAYTAKLFALVSPIWAALVEHVSTTEIMSLMQVLNTTATTLQAGIEALLEGRAVLSCASSLLLLAHLEKREKEWGTGGGVGDVDVQGTRRRREGGGRSLARWCADLRSLHVSACVALESLACAYSLRVRTKLRDYVLNIVWRDLQLAGFGDGARGGLGGMHTSGVSGGGGAVSLGESSFLPDGLDDGLLQRHPTELWLHSSAPVDFFVLVHRLLESAAESHIPQLQWKMTELVQSVVRLHVNSVEAVVCLHPLHDAAAGGGGGGEGRAFSVMRGVRESRLVALLSAQINNVRLYLQECKLADRHLRTRLRGTARGGGFLYPSQLLNSRAICRLQDKWLAPLATFLRSRRGKMMRRMSMQRSRMQTPAGSSPEDVDVEGENLVDGKAEGGAGFPDRPVSPSLIEQKGKEDENEDVTQKRETDSADAELEEKEKAGGKGGEGTNRTEGDGDGEVVLPLASPNDSAMPSPSKGKEEKDEAKSVHERGAPPVVSPTKAADRPAVARSHSSNPFAEEAALEEEEEASRAKAEKEKSEQLKAKGTDKETDSRRVTPPVPKSPSVSSNRFSPSPPHALPSATPSPVRARKEGGDSNTPSPSPARQKPQTQTTKDSSSPFGIGFPDGEPDAASAGAEESVRLVHSLHHPPFPALPLPQNGAPVSFTGRLAEHLTENGLSQEAGGFTRFGQKAQAAVVSLVVGPLLDEIDRCRSVMEIDLSGLPPAGPDDLNDAVHRLCSAPAEAPRETGGAARRMHTLLAHLYRDMHPHFLFGVADEVLKKTLAAYISKLLFIRPANVAAHYRDSRRPSVMAAFFPPSGRASAGRQQQQQQPTLALTEHDEIFLGDFSERRSYLRRVFDGLETRVEEDAERLRGAFKTFYLQWGEETTERLDKQLSVLFDLKSLLCAPTATAALRLWPCRRRFGPAFSLSIVDRIFSLRSAAAGRWGAKRAGCYMSKDERVRLLEDCHKHFAAVAVRPRHLGGSGSFHHHSRNGGGHSHNHGGHTRHKGDHRASAFRRGGRPEGVVGMGSDGMGDSSSAGESGEAGTTPEAALMDSVWEHILRFADDKDAKRQSIASSVGRALQRYQGGGSVSSSETQAVQGEAVSLPVGSHRRPPRPGCGEEERWVWVVENYWVQWPQSQFLSRFAAMVPPPCPLHRMPAGAGPGGAGDLVEVPDIIPPLLPAAAASSSSGSARRRRPSNGGAGGGGGAAAVSAARRGSSSGSRHGRGSGGGGVSQAAVALSPVLPTVAMPLPLVASLNLLPSHSHPHSGNMSPLSGHGFRLGSRKVESLSCGHAGGLPSDFFIFLNRHTRGHLIDETGPSPSPFAHPDFAKVKALAPSLHRCHFSMYFLGPRALSAPPPPSQLTLFPEEEEYSEASERDDASSNRRASQKTRSISGEGRQGRSKASTTSKQGGGAKGALFPPPRSSDQQRGGANPFSDSEGDHGLSGDNRGDTSGSAGGVEDGEGSPLTDDASPADLKTKAQTFHAANLETSASPGRGQTGVDSSGASPAEGQSGRTKHAETVVGQFLNSWNISSWWSTQQLTGAVVEEASPEGRGEGEGSPMGEGGGVLSGEESPIAEGGEGGGDGGGESGGSSSPCSCDSCLAAAETAGHARMGGPEASTRSGLRQTERSGAASGSRDTGGMKGGKGKGFGGRKGRDRERENDGERGDQGAVRLEELFPVYSALHRPHEAVPGSLQLEAHVWTRHIGASPLPGGGFPLRSCCERLWVKSQDGMLLFFRSRTDEISVFAVPLLSVRALDVAVDDEEAEAGGAGGVFADKGGKWKADSAGGVSREQGFRAVSGVTWQRLLDPVELGVEREGTGLEGEGSHGAPPPLKTAGGVFGVVAGGDESQWQREEEEKKEETAEDEIGAIFGWGLRLSVSHPYASFPAPFEGAHGGATPGFLLELQFISPEERNRWAGVLASTCHALRLLAAPVIARTAEAVLPALRDRLASAQRALLLQSGLLSSSDGMDSLDFELSDFYPSGWEDEEPQGGGESEDDLDFPPPPPVLLIFDPLQSADQFSSFPPTMLADEFPPPSAGTAGRQRQTQEGAAGVRARAMRAAQGGRGGDTSRAGSGREKSQQRSRHSARSSESSIPGAAWDSGGSVDRRTDGGSVGLPPFAPSSGPPPPPIVGRNFLLASTYGRPLYSCAPPLHPLARLFPEPPFGVWQCEAGVRAHEEMGDSLVAKLSVASRSGWRQVGDIPSALFEGDLGEEGDSFRRGGGTSAVTRVLRRGGDSDREGAAAAAIRPTSTPHEQAYASLFANSRWGLLGRLFDASRLAFLGSRFYGFFFDSHASSLAAFADERGGPDLVPF
uniref:Uncharacterized protein n=1 Tax=Chromera velia CCMP2878 TaxID=1169474 RepID=A0A0G4GFS7_9ALVE|eukprot:Cvel_21695.t1-p1 / transcript=Cvel_21695.t1 / gene=Cvel_21695 / organism=Chromera_velia_CCMP2878 / gene_product=hypothetical protein / transcript_product=hypothetical protein / location=Cvel_scaffold2057:8060-17752(+) / protein_length=2490 / sequence_SO=supercontig / SO=protein_coding / is_pseudo=false